jgi:isoquinoline 1-oxidoreductase subunit beta
MENDTNGNFMPNPWLRISQDNTVTVYVNKSELGQGTHTSLAMIVADELDADWGSIRVETAPARDEYNDPVMGGLVTGGSMGVRNMYDILRHAGAAAKDMLVRAAAQEWGVPSQECTASKGTVRHEKSGRTITYGRLCRRASQLPTPESPVLKSESEFVYQGKSMPRLDVPDKVSGKAVFGTDIVIDDMVYAVVAMPPTYGARPVSWKDEDALKISGVQRVIELEAGLAIVATSFHSAVQGRRALQAEWNTGTHPEMDTQYVEAHLVDCLDRKGLVVKAYGDTESAMKRASSTVEAFYQVPYLAHATFEPQNCTAHVREDRCDIWAPTQAPTAVLNAGAAIAGLDPKQVHVHTTYSGGGFGRRLEIDAAEQALTISKDLERPVKVMWTREDDMRQDFYRPGACSRIQAGLDQEGCIIAWSHKAVYPSILERNYPQMLEGGIDPTAVEGITDTRYDFGSLRLEYVNPNLPVPVGFWRSVGHSINGFVVESFMDELAYAAGKDPLEFRLNHLAGQPRAAAVLRKAATESGWGDPLPEGSGRGIAQHFSFGSYAAHVAEVSVAKDTRDLRIDRIVSAMDCGRAVNPNSVAAQVEGAVIMGLSAALKEKLKFAGGGVKSSNFHNYRLLTLKESPEIEVHIVTSNEKLGGVGEPGLPPVAPAVANAIFAAAGVRIRTLPITSGKTRDAPIDK